MAAIKISGYCVKCKEKRPIQSPEAVFLGDHGRPAVQGLCPDCGTKLTRFGRVPLHDVLRTSGPKMVIVESPAKARTVSRFLGRGFAVEASVGHIRDLPANRMGVDIDHDFTPRYVIPVKKRPVVKKLRTRAEQASAVYLATDPDREGEAIAWHLAAALDQQVRGIPVQRVEFHEITRHAVEQAFAHPREIDQLRVDAQQARRILDRVVGFTLSPLLREKIGHRGLSAGRVQSVALRLVCEREREIGAFAAEEYWTVEAELRKQRPAALTSRPATNQAHGGRNQARGPEGRDQSFLARLIKIRGKDAELKTEADAQAVVVALQDAAYVVHKVVHSQRTRQPAPPFLTSTLQQDASRQLGFSAQRTMKVAQALYEGKDIGEGERVGLITYMRTDSVHVAESAQAEAREFVLDQFGAEYLPSRPPQYKTRSAVAQEAHEAIRPTSVLRTPSSLEQYLERDELRLYTQIWRRFVASQMVPAILDQTRVDIQAGPEHGEKPYHFRATGSVIKFPGFLRVYEESREDDEKEEEGSGVQLPPLDQGEQLDLLRLLPKQHFTQPPPRYSDASLIRALEEYGIGRPSTYAPTLSTLLQRRYVEKQVKKLVPTDLGFEVNDRLVEFFSSIINVHFTAEMEDRLDRIATGGQAWVPMLREFHGPFAKAVEEAQEKMSRVEWEPEPTGDLCPQCGSPLLFRRGRHGKFIGCSGWPDCRYTTPIPLDGVRCPECGSAVVERRGRRGRRFYGCASYRPGDVTSCQWTAQKRPGAAEPSEGTRPAGSDGCPQDRC